MYGFAGFFTKIIRLFAGHAGMQLHFEFRKLRITTQKDECTSPKG